MLLTAPTPGEAVAQRTITAYTLTPEQMYKSEGLYRTRNVLTLADTIFSLVLLAVLIGTRFAPRLLCVVQALFRRRWAQAIVFFPVVLLLLSLLGLPLEIYGHHIQRAYGLSVQSWGSWAADWLKGQAISLVLVTGLLSLIYWVIRKFPRAWWVIGWAVVSVIMFVLVFLAPVVLDPIFNRFEPLAKTNPQLTVELQKLAHSAGLEIPESRIFLMHASDKVTTYNAYVTGLGATKRIVVWDTTARDMTLGQTLFIFGHETGHYVLHHIYKGLAFGVVLMLFGFWLLKLLAERLLARYGEPWKVPSVADWASLPVLILLLSVISFFGQPISSSFSRGEEHQADVYGLRITAPINANSAQVAAQAFQVLGEKSYAYPSPSPWLVLWTYSHPPIADRVRFALEHPDGR